MTMANNKFKFFLILNFLLFPRFVFGYSGLNLPNFLRFSNDVDVDITVESSLLSMDDDDPTGIVYDINIQYIPNMYSTVR